MKNRKGNLLMTLGLVLILAALALVGYNQWDASRAQQESDDALMALEQIRIQRQMESQQTAAPPVVTATMMPTDTPATDNRRADGGCHCDGCPGSIHALRN